MNDIQQEIQEAVELLSTLLDEKPPWWLASILNTLTRAGEEIEEASRVANEWFADREKVKAERNALHARVKELEVFRDLVQRAMAASGDDEILDDTPMRENYTQRWLEWENDAHRAMKGANND